MNCKSKLHKLGDVLDGEVPFFRRLLFYLHIGMCPPCRRYFNQFKGMKEAASEITPDDLPEDFFQVMDKAILQLKPPTNTCPHAKQQKP